MTALNRVKSLELSKYTVLSIALGALFALSPFYADFGGSALATLTAIVLGVLAVAVATAEAAGSPRFKNHGRSLAAIAAVILIMPWILALTGVGQVLVTFSLAALALGAAATWSIVGVRENKVLATGGAKSKDGSDAETSSVADTDDAGTEKVVANQDEQVATAKSINARSNKETPSAKDVQASASEDDSENRPRSAEVKSVAGNGQEGQQTDEHDDHGHGGKADPKPAAEIGAIKPKTSTQKEPAKAKNHEPIIA